MSKPAFRALALVVLAGALVFRTAGLGRRPMHHDEANQAVKFGDLLERGEYRYDPGDHHGPSLYYLTLPLARLAGRHTLVALDESLLRLLPALFGAGTVLLLLVFPGTGRTAALASGLLAAISPLAVYYSRFYIQETIFVFFAVGFLAAAWRYIMKPSAGRAAAAGLLAGLMYATKETSVIVLAAAAAAFGLSRFAGGGEARSPGAARVRPVRDLAAAALAGIVPAGLLFSSFFRNPGGIADSFLAFRTYIERSAGAGLHAQPWTYYFRTLAFYKSGPGPAWTEALVLVLAAVGACAALRKKRTSPAGAILFYTILSALAFSLIPYKTPWNALPFHAGLLVLAGLGAESLLRNSRPKVLRFTAAGLVLTGAIHLGIQAWRANFVYYADPRNPYAYAQTGRDYLKLIRRLDDLSSLRPEGRRMSVQVFADPHETWPLPWSLRSYTNVGYWTDAAAAGTAPGAVPVIIASAEEALKLAPRIGSDYHLEYYGLRPEVLLALHVRNDLWEKYLAERAGR